MSNMKAKERKSLCEESMLVFVNILKLSSLSIARKSVVTKSVVNHHQASTPPLSPVPKPQRSKRLQKPDQPPESKLSYVMLPNNEPAAASSYVMKDQITTVEGQFSDYIKRFHQKTENDMQNSIVEGKAADYIKRFHEKNMNDLNNESMRSMCCLPHLARFSSSLV